MNSVLGVEIGRHWQWPENSRRIHIRHANQCKPEALHVQAPVRILLLVLGFRRARRPRSTVRPVYVTGPHNRINNADGHSFFCQCFAPHAPIFVPPCCPGETVMNESAFTCLLRLTLFIDLCSTCSACGSIVRCLTCVLLLTLLTRSALDLQCVSIASPAARLAALIWRPLGCARPAARVVRSTCSTLRA